MEYLILSLFAIIGIIMLYFSIRNFNRKKEAFETATNVEGIVVENRREISNDGYVYYPTIEYTYQNEKFYWEADVGQSPAKKIGKVVKLQISKEGGCYIRIIFLQIFW